MMSATEADLIAAAGVAVAGAEAVETVVASPAVAGAEVVRTVIASATVAGAEAVETVIASAAVAGAEVVEMVVASAAVAGAEVMETVVASAAVAGAEVVETAMVAAADVADAAADRPRLDKDARELKLQRNQIASSLAAEPIGTGVAAAKPAAKLWGSNFIFSVCLGLFAVGFAAVHGQQSALSNMLSRPPLPLPSPPSKLFGLF